MFLKLTLHFKLFINFYLIYTAAIAQVEKWLDDLHIRRQYLELSWQSRKTQLEQCLALAMLAKDLRELEEIVNERREMLANTDHLGKRTTFIIALQYGL